MESGDSDATYCTDDGNVTEAGVDEKSPHELQKQVISDTSDDDETIASSASDMDTTSNVACDTNYVDYCNLIAHNDDWMSKSEECWCIGDRCRAPFSGDELYYDAVIKSIVDNKAEVVFVDYENDGSELVSLSLLKCIGKRILAEEDRVEIPDNSERLFKHLRVKSEQDVTVENTWLKDIVQLGDSIKRIHPLFTSNTSCSTLNYKDLQLACDKSTDGRSASDYPGALKVFHPGSEALKLDADGFDDVDYERPRFKNIRAGPTTPFVLSSATEEDSTVQIPGVINRYLRDYQREGVQFLYNNYKCNHGSILGDDMGLGKTVQIIALIAAIFGKTGTKEDVMKDSWWKMCSFSSRKRGTFLIVSPGSVLYNWIDELNTWGHFKIGRFHSSHKEDTLIQLERGKLDIVVTTFETLRNHLDDLNNINWLAVIVDEAHRLKESKSKVTIAMKNLKCRRRIGLTGTAMQNRLSEFWCLLDWANPACLGNLATFQRNYEFPIKQGRKFNVTKRELAKATKKSAELTQLHSRWFLRRTKLLIADQLPKKDEKVVFCHLSELQTGVYETLLENQDVELVVKQFEPCNCGRSSNKVRGKCCYQANHKGEKINYLLMHYLQLLMKTANHIALLLPQIYQSEDHRLKAKEICSQLYSRFPQFKAVSSKASLLTLSDPLYCGKMKAFEVLLKKFVKENSKVLLFSYSLQLLNILETYVLSKGITYSRLDGSTRIEHRAEITRRFNTDPRITLCLVSTKAGCLGLNFTGANVVVIFDPNWNPAYDIQAQDRAYRIGQRCDVRVYRLITSGTIEEVMYLRQIYKLQLANVAMQNSKERRYFTGVADDKQQHGEIFGIENLFSLRRSDVCLAQDIIKRTEQVEAGLTVAKYENSNSILAKNEDATDQTSNYEVKKEKGTDAKNDDDDDELLGLKEIASQYLKKQNDDDDDFDGDSAGDQSCKTKNRDEINNCKNLDQGPTFDEGGVEDYVQYYCSNTTVLGSSKAEQYMTSTALRDVYLKKKYSQEPANQFNSGNESDDLGEIEKEILRSKEFARVASGSTPGTSGVKLNQQTMKAQKNRFIKYDSANSEHHFPEKNTQLEQKIKPQYEYEKVGGNELGIETHTRVIVGKTPVAIRKKQFHEMSHFFGFENRLDFANAILNYTTEKRLDMLAEFYRIMDAKAQ